MPDASQPKSLDSHKPANEKVAQASSTPTTNRGEEVIKQLEALAVPCSKPKSALHNAESDGLSDYSAGFCGLNISRFVSKLKDKFPGEPFIAADIGGSMGTAALDLERIGCDRCFVIDPRDHRTVSSSQLPPNRFIQRYAESLEGIPDDCFHFIISFNSLYYSKDLSRSISEIFRVLKTGGAAIIDIEFWATEARLEAMNNLNLPENANIQLIHFDFRKKERSLFPLARVLEVANKTLLDKKVLNTQLGSGFFIQKALSSE